MKYARATWWIFLAWLARRACLPKRIVWEAEDQASMRMFSCTLDFEVAKTVAPVGWYCEHMSMTSNATLHRPTTWCGCQMQPILR